jgi:hypothetical protein
MELQTEQRRSRKRARKTTGTLIRTLNDARGFCEPLSRYGELPTCRLADLYKAINGLAATSNYPLERLRDIFHETEGLPTTQQLLIRPEYQWRYGINHQTIYRKTLGTNQFLHTSHIYDSDQLRWANTSQIVQLSIDHYQSPSTHDAALALAASSIEIGVRRTPELKYITHIETLMNASAEAKRATSPLSIPVKKIEHIFPNGKRVAFEDIHVKPDNLFGIQYPSGAKFYAVELDRSTEDIEPTQNLQRQSWLRKILAYVAMSKHPNPAYRTYLQIPNLQVICLFQDARRMAHAMQLAKRHGAHQLLFGTIPPIDPLLDTSMMPRLLAEPYRRINGTFNIATLAEGR